MSLHRNIMRPLLLTSRLLFLALCLDGCGGGGGSGGTAEVNNYYGTIPQDDSTSNNTQSINLDTSSSTSGNTVFFESVVDTISSAKVSNGCVFFVGDSVSANSISHEFCADIPTLPSNLSDSATGLRVSDGNCPTVVAYENTDFAGASETIDFCKIDRFAVSCANCSDTNSTTESTISPHTSTSIEVDTSDYFSRCMVSDGFLFELRTQPQETSAVSQYKYSSNGTDFVHFSYLRDSSSLQPSCYQITPNNPGDFFVSENRLFSSFGSELPEFERQPINSFQKERICTFEEVHTFQSEYDSQISLYANAPCN